MANRPELERLLEEALAAAPAAAWEAKLVEVGVPAGLVGDVGEAIERARRFGLDPVIEVGDGHPAQIRHPVRYTGAALTADIAWLRKKLG